MTVNNGKTLTINGDDIKLKFTVYFNPRYYNKEPYLSMSLMPGDTEEQIDNYGKFVETWMSRVKSHSKIIDYVEAIEGPMETRVYADGRVETA